MSGIVGVFNRNGAPVDREVLEGMSRLLAHRGGDERVWTAGPMGMAGELSLLDGGVVVAFDGRLDDRKDFGETSDGEFVAASYRALGEKFIESLSGDFALAIYDLREKKLLLARDSLGARPLYVWESPQRFILASEIKAILAHPDVPRLPDPDGLAAILLGGRVLESRDLTCFKGIRTVLPSTIQRVTSDGVATRVYWDFDVESFPVISSFEEYAEGYREQLTRAVRRRLRSSSPVAVSVSGGLDSSAIFGLAQQAGDPLPVGVSYQGLRGTPADEEIYLSALERQTSARIRRVTLDPSLDFTSTLESQVWHVEAPMPDVNWSLLNRVYGEATVRGCKVLLTGHWGDQIQFTRGYHADLFRRGKWTKIVRHLSEYKRWYGPGEADFFTNEAVRMIARSFFRENWISALRRVQRWRRRKQESRSWYSARLWDGAYESSAWDPHLKSSFRDYHSKFLYTEARSRYHVLGLEWDNKLGAAMGLDFRFPFLDRDLIQFLINVPGEYHSYEGIPRNLLRRAMRDVLPPEIALRKSKGDQTDYLNAVLSKEVALILERLGELSATTARGYLNSANLEREIRRIQRIGSARESALAWEIEYLLGLETWLRVFFEKPDRFKLARRRHGETNKEAGEKEGVSHAHP